MNDSTHFNFIFDAISRNNKYIFVSVYGWRVMIIKVKGLSLIELLKISDVLYFCSIS